MSATRALGRGDGRLALRDHRQRSSRPGRRLEGGSAEGGRFIACASTGSAISSLPTQGWADDQHLQPCGTDPSLRHPPRTPHKLARPYHPNHRLPRAGRPNSRISSIAWSRAAQMRIDPTSCAGQRHSKKPIPKDPHRSLRQRRPAGLLRRRSGSRMEFFFFQKGERRKEAAAGIGLALFVEPAARRAAERGSGDQVRRLRNADLIRSPVRRAGPRRYIPRSSRAPRIFPGKHRFSRRHPDGPAPRRRRPSARRMMQHAARSPPTRRSIKKGVELAAKDSKSRPPTSNSQKEIQGERDGLSSPSKRSSAPRAGSTRRAHGPSGPSRAARTSPRSR